MAEHVNNFSGGLHKDNQPQFQPEGTYRDAKNFTLVNHDGNNWALKDALGNRKIFTIDPPYSDDSPVTAAENPMPIGFISFVDSLIVFSTNDETDAGAYGEIGILYFNNFGESVDYEARSITIGLNTWTYNGYVPLYGHEGLAFSKQHKIEGFGFAENDSLKRIYWTDNNNEPRVLNTVDPIFTNYIASGSLVTGTQYMVLGGIVTHAFTNYGPGVPVNGNVFTASGANYTVLSGQPLVIEYFDVNLLDWTPDTSLGDMFFDSFGTGSCYCGNRMYFHRLKSSDAGTTTSWSYGMFPVHVGLNQSPNPVINSQHNYVGAGSTSSLVNSNKSVKIRVTNIDTKYDTIEIACAEFDQTKDVPYNISIVVSTDITSDEMTFEDFGNINLGTLTIDDLTLAPAAIAKCKTLTTNKNYNIIGNITEREEFENFDISTVILDDFIYQMPVDNDSEASCSNTITFGGGGNTIVNPSTGVNPSLSNDIQHGTRWVVTVGQARYPAAGGTVYSVGEVFVGDNSFGAGYKDWAQVTVGAQIRPATFLQRYEPINNTDQRYDVQEIKTYTGWDYRNPLVASMCKGYRSSEKYRFGILFYDKKRNPYYVRWIGDHTFDSIYDKDGLLVQTDVGGNDWWVLQANLLKIDALRIPKDIVDKIDGFSIVRAECDPSIITQGLWWQTQYYAGHPSGTPVISPLPSLTLQDGNGRTVDTNNHVCSFICPDYMVDDDYVTNAIPKIGDTIRVAGWLNPAALSDNGYYYKLTSFSNPTVSGGFEWATKLYQHVDATDTSYNNESTVTNYAGVIENDTVSNFIPGRDFYNKEMWTGTSNYTIDADCYSPNTTNDANDITMVGGKKLVMKNAVDFFTYNGAYRYSDPSGTNKNDPKKCLVNYMSGNTNQYGGTGEAALAATLYMSTGHYQQIDSQVIADNCDTGVPSAYNYLEFNGIHVGGGDTFVCMIDYGYGLHNSGYADSGSYGVMFPCECRVNYNLRRGRKVSDFGMHRENYGVTFVGGSFTSTQGLEEFGYNLGYTSDGTIVKYPALPLNFSGSIRFPYRIRWAGQKFSGEQIDSFRVFLTNDYRDVDGQLGEINNLKSREGKTYYWQNKGVGYVPILERQTISATAGEATTLGTGGVIDRFDTISAFYGNQHQWSLTETDMGYIWFDMRNKDVVVMSASGSLDAITPAMGLKSYFSEIFLEKLTTYFSGTFLNSQTFAATSDMPLMGTGIIGVYDPKNKTSYLTFKFKSWYQEAALDAVTTYDEYQVLSKDFTIGFNHILNKFVGFFDKTPAIWHNHNQIVLSANNPKNLNVYYGSDMVVPTPVTIGDVIASGTKEYVCVASGLVNAYATPPIGTLFTQINKTNDIYVDNEEKNYSVVRQGYQYNACYGRVINNEVEIVVNPKTSEPVVFDNIIQSSNNVNFTDIYVETSDQTASDLSIEASNRDYQYTDKSWRSSVPISTSGRMVDFYMKVRAVKKNWTANPSTLVKDVKIVAFIKTLFRLSK